MKDLLRMVLLGAVMLCLTAAASQAADAPTSTDTAKPTASTTATAPPDAKANTTDAQSTDDAAAKAPAKSPPATRGFGERLWRFIGVFHPAVVHFPIALLVIAAFFIMLRWRYPSISPDVAFYCLWLGAISAIVASAMGWSYAPQKSYGDMWAGPDADIFWHRWLGVTVTVMSITVAILATRARAVAKRRRIEGEEYNDYGPRAEKWHMGVLLVAVLVGLTGHIGGELVYGSDMYSIALRKLMNWPEPKPAAAKATTSDGGNSTTQTPAVKIAPAPPPGQKVDFTASIQPILELHCIKCHGPTKHKAKFRLDTKDNAFKSGDNAPDNLVPGKPVLSDLYYRVMTSDTDDMMPPDDEGGPLPKDQIALIERWIKEGATWPDGVTLTDKSPHKH